MFLYVLEVIILFFNNLYCMNDIYKLKCKNVKAIIKDKIKDIT